MMDRIETCYTKLYYTAPWRC